MRVQAPQEDRLASDKWHLGLNGCCKISPSIRTIHREEVVRSPRREGGLAKGELCLMKKFTELKAKKRINGWLRDNGQRSIVLNLSYVDFANELSRRVSPRHAWQHFEDKDEAIKFIQAFAQALPKPQG